MIVSASYKTDIPAFYGPWFLNRLDAGFCTMVNPYNAKGLRVELTRPAVDGFVFWTKNIGPFLDGLAQVAARGFPFVVQHSVTGLPGSLERSVPDWRLTAERLAGVRDRWGPRAVVWRYDPIVLTADTPPAWHRQTFAALARALRGTTDEVVVSFLEPYRKTARNLVAAGVAWRDPDLADKRALLGDLAVVAAGEGMRLTLCTQPDLIDPADASSGLGAGMGVGWGPARCVDAARLSDVAGRALAAREKGNRPGCLCAESRDIGDYDSCPHGCVYCYAVASRAAAQRRFTRHDPAGETLVPRPLTGTPS